MNDISEDNFNKICNNQNINDIINLKKQINMSICAHYNKIEELKKQIIILEKNLNVLCKHKWKRDNTYYGEHSQYTCDLCGLYK
jgi:hypothetical protein